MHSLKRTEIDRNRCREALLRVTLLAVVITGAAARAASPAKPGSAVPAPVKASAPLKTPVMVGRVTVTATPDANLAGNDAAGPAPLPYLVRNFQCADPNLRWLSENLPGADMPGHSSGEYLYRGVQAPQFDVARALKLLLHDDDAQVSASVSVEAKYNLFKRGQREPLESVVRDMRTAYLASWGAVGLPEVYENVQFTTGLKELTERYGRIRLLVHQVVARDVVTADLGGKPWSPVQSVIPVLIPAYDIIGFEVPAFPAAFRPIRVTKITAPFNPCASLGARVQVSRGGPEAEIRLCPARGVCPPTDAAALARVERALDVSGLSAWRVRGRKIYVQPAAPPKKPVVVPPAPLE